MIEAYRDTTADELDYVASDNVAWNLALELVFRKADAVGGCVLDVGCHTGWFLAQLTANWRRFGIEQSLGPTQAARVANCVEIIADRIESVPARWEGFFDVVTLFDVFEHLVSPVEGVRRALDLLRPGGQLILSTGDMDAWTWRLAGGRHWYLQTPQHLSVGSRTFFRRLDRQLPLRLRLLRRIPHRRAGAGERLREAIEFLHWECLQRGGLLRIPQRMIQALPPFRHLRHRQSGPWALALRDHVFVVYERV